VDEVREKDIRANDIASVFGVSVLRDNGAGEHACEASAQATVPDQVRDGHTVVQHMRSDA
jgi:hypothetical protein